LGTHIEASISSSQNRGVTAAMEPFLTRWRSKGGGVDLEATWWEQGGGGTGVHGGEGPAAAVCEWWSRVTVGAVL
jgi:hypothetical protein